MPNTFKIGDIGITVVSDGEGKSLATEYITDSTPAMWQPHAALLDDAGFITYPFTCFLVRSADKTVLIDTGLGPLPGDTFRGGDLMRELASVGVAPADIDTVFITHLHMDHCGSAALYDERRQLHVAFPHATYRWTSAEQAYWSGALPPTQIARRDIFAAVAPRWEPAEGGASLAPGVDVYAIPGHTPGHAGIVVSSGTERAFILGDAIHCPAQVTESEWSSMGDVDPKLARAGQEAALREAEASNALIRACHFPGLSFGRILRTQGNRYWSPT